MKKVLKLVLCLLVLFLIFEFIVYIFKSNHEIEYVLKTKNGSYKVYEIFDEDKYYFKINSKNSIYSFDIFDYFDKKKEIIKDIYTYKTDDFVCIYPVLKDKNEDVNIICSKDNVTYSYSYFKDDLNGFVKKLMNLGYFNYSWEKDSNKEKNIETLVAYPGGIREGVYIYVYKYDGFFSINSDSMEKVNLFKNDVYVNHLGTYVDKYYIIPNYDQKYDYDELYRIDMTNNKVKTIKLKKEISKDSYINGIVDNEVYIFDKDELVQYSVNPKKKKVKEVGNKKDGVLYYDLEFAESDVYRFRDEEVLFKTIDDYISKIEGNEITYISKNMNSYYYQTSDNNVYYVNAVSKNKVLLFNKEISDFVLIDDTIYFISDDSLYSYSNIYGVDKILTYSELSFNSKNRIAIYME